MRKKRGGEREPASQEKIIINSAAAITITITITTTTTTTRVEKYSSYLRLCLIQVSPKICLADKKISVDALRLVEPELNELGWIIKS